MWRRRRSSSTYLSWGWPTAQSRGDACDKMLVSWVYQPASLSYFMFDAKYLSNILYSVLEILNTVWTEKGESLTELPGQTTTSVPKFQEDELKISLQYFYNITLFLNMLLQDPGRNFNFTLMKITKPKPRWNTVHYVLMAKPVRHRTWTGL